MRLRDLRAFVVPRSAALAVPLGRTAIAAVYLTAVLFLSYSLAKDGVHLPFASAARYHVEAVFDDAAGLRAANEPPVSVAGVPVGKVTSVRYTGGRALVRMDLDPQARGRIFADATARVRPLNGANVLSLDIQPGSPAAGPLPDRPIPPSRATVPVASDQLLDTLDADTRAYLGVVLGETATALRGRGGDVAAALDRTASLTDAAGEVTRMLRTRRTLVTALVGELTRIFTTLGRRRDELRTTLDGADRLLQASGARDTELATAVRGAPGLLDETGRTLDVVRRESGPLTATLRRMIPAARALAPALRATRDVLPDLRELLAGTGVLARGGRATLQDAARFLDRLNGVSPQVVAAVASVEGAVKGIDEHGRSLIDAGDYVSGLTSGQDDRSVVVRARLLGVESPRPENFGLPAGTSRATLNRALAKALDAQCRTSAGSCLLRFLTPGLTQSVVGEPPVVRRAVRGRDR